MERRYPMTLTTEELNALYEALTTFVEGDDVDGETIELIDSAWEKIKVVNS